MNLMNPGRQMIHVLIHVQKTCEREEVVVVPIVVVPVPIVPVIRAAVWWVE